jgi:hypothetical protein
MSGPFFLARLLDLVQLFKLSFATNGDADRKNRARIYTSFRIFCMDSRRKASCAAPGFLPGLRRMIDRRSTDMWVSCSTCRCCQDGREGVGECHGDAKF